MDDQNKNLILATALSFVVILTWFILFPPEEQAPSPPPPVDVVQTVPGTAAVPGADTVLAVPGPVAADTPIADAPRVPIVTPNLTGSLSLIGGRIDDLSLVRYEESLEPDAPTVRLLQPEGQPDAYYSLTGWLATDGVEASAVPGPLTEWTLESGTTLTPDTPVTIAWDNGAGLIFRNRISVDRQFMFTVAQSVENTGGTAATLRPYSSVLRHGEPSNLKKFFILHEGLVRLSDDTLQSVKYSAIEDADPVNGVPTDRIEVQTDGWIGYTDHYWMTTLIPPQDSPFLSISRYLSDRNIYQADALLPDQTVAPGATATVETRVFAGAKEWETIREYQNDGGVDRFIDSIDWGWFFFLTKPIFAVLHFLNGVIGNMGWSIIALTLFLKALLFPLAYKSYVSMARMKELQPEMEALKEKSGDDRQAMQQGMMKLYKDNKVNPASGCLPILLQIPIFFSLYKVIFVTIELRQAPFILWIHDLSAPDPTSILNLFGLLPWATPDQGSLLFILSLGVLPILLGISMWIQQKLNPAPTDPTQKMVFAFMPWIFMFMLGSFASGLVLYWIANNTITFTQQYLIMRRHGHRPDVFGNVLTGLRLRKPAPATTVSLSKPANTGARPSPTTAPKPAPKPGRK